MSELCVWAASVILQASGTAAKEDLCGEQTVTTQPPSSTHPLSPSSPHPRRSSQHPVHQHSVHRHLGRSPLFSPYPSIHPHSFLQHPPSLQLAPSTQIVIEFSRQPQTRPRSGRQLFQQRQAALQAGQVYTRLPTHSFESQWRQAVYQPTYEDWISLLAREAQSMAMEQRNNPLTIIVGDSLSLWMPTEFLPHHRFWLNQSISGETAAAMLKRLHAFEQTHPDRIHVMAGINDLKNGATDPEVLQSLREMMRHLRSQHPEATIIIHSILPTRLPHLPSDRIRSINRALRDMTHQEEIDFLDLQRHFTDDDGHLNQTLTTDGLHLNYHGYLVWQSLIHQLR